MITWSYTMAKNCDKVLNKDLHLWFLVFSFDEFKEIFEKF